MDPDQRTLPPGVETVKPVAPPEPTNPLWKKHTYGEGQEDEYELLPGVVRPGSRDAPFISTWELEPQEVEWVLRQIVAKQSVIISVQMLTGGGSINPILLTAGLFDEPYLSGPTPVMVDPPKGRM